jgi:hypothetical protein
MSLRPIPSALIPKHFAQHQGHEHFWQRAFSRRQFLGGAVGSAAVVAGSGLIDSRIVAAHDKPGIPKPIPGGIQPGGPGTPLFHVQFLGLGVENSTITDFNGSIGATDVQGTGVGTNLVTGKKTELLFDTDMRFMKGTFVGTDGHVHHATFGFV